MSALVHAVDHVRGKPHHSNANDHQQRGVEEFEHEFMLPLAGSSARLVDERLGARREHLLDE